MSIFTKFRPLAIVSGVALMLPAAMAAADEPIRLDAGQLDAITAGDIVVGGQIEATANAFGFITQTNSSFGDFQTTATPALGIGVGAAGGTAIAIGNDDGVGPTAETPPPTVSNVEGKVLFDRTFGRSFGRDGTYAAAFSYRVVVVADDSLGVFD